MCRIIVVCVTLVVTECFYLHSSVLTFSCIDLFSCYCSIWDLFLMDSFIFTHGFRPSFSTVLTQAQIVSILRSQIIWIWQDSEAHQYFLSTLPLLCADNMLAAAKNCANKGMLSSSLKQVAHYEEGIGFHQHLWEDYPTLWWEGVYFFPPLFFFLCISYKSADDLARTKANSSFHTRGRYLIWFYFLLLSFMTDI